MDADDEQQTVPRAFNDPWRAQWSSLLATLLVVPALLIVNRDRLHAESLTEWVAGSTDLLLLLGSLTWIVFGLLYLGWTQLIFGRLDAARLSAITARQARERHTLSDELSGFGGPVSWSVSTAIIAVLVSVFVMLNADRWPPLVAPVLAIAVAMTSWVSMTYAYALRYARLAASGATFRFSIAEEPRFVDFLSLSFLTSTLHGSEIHPTTRAGLKAVRGHALTAFMFNAVVVALTVSLVVTSVSR